MSACATTGAAGAGKVRWPPGLQARAAFDLSCAAEELKLTPLEKLPGCFGGTCLKTAGIEGCGKKVTYLFVQPGDQWVLNSTSR